MPNEYYPEREANHAAYVRLKPEIDRQYPADRFVAIYDGRVVADAATFEELFSVVHELTTRPRAVLVIQAGVNYPKEAVIFIGEPLG